MKKIFVYIVVVLSLLSLSNMIPNASALISNSGYLEDFSGDSGNPTASWYTSTFGSNTPMRANAGQIETFSTGIGCGGGTACTFGITSGTLFGTNDWTVEIDFSATQSITSDTNANCAYESFFYLQSSSGYSGNLFSIQVKVGPDTGTPGPGNPCDQLLISTSCGSSGFMPATFSASISGHHTISYVTSTNTATYTGTSSLGGYTCNIVNAAFENIRRIGFAYQAQGGDATEDKFYWDNLFVDLNDGGAYYTPDVVDESVGSTSAIFRSVAVDYDLVPNVYFNDIAPTVNSHKLYKADVDISNLESMLPCSTFGTSSLSLSLTIDYATDNLISYTCDGPNTFTVGSIEIAPSFQYIDGQDFTKEGTFDSEETGFYEIDVSNSNAENNCSTWQSAGADRGVDFVNFVDEESVSHGTEEKICKIDKFTEKIFVLTDDGIVHVIDQVSFFDTGDELSQTNIDSIYIEVANNKLYSLDESGNLDVYTVNTAGTTLTFVGTVSASGSTKLNISPDGLYVVGYSSNTLYLFSSTPALLVSAIYPESIVDAAFDISNNYVYSVHQSDTVIRADIYDYTSSTGGAGTPGNLNPTPDEDLLPTVIGGDEVPSIGGGTGGGGPGGGFQGSGDNFLGIDLVTFGEFLPTGEEGAKWLIGIVIVMIVIYSLYRVVQSPIVIPFGALLGVGLAVGVGMLPVWFIMAIVLLMIIIVANIFYGGGDDE